jgi:hypothetical protein
VTLNRRHKSLVFITVVITGCSLLLGAEIKDALGFLLLGFALAWAVGSDTATNIYRGLRNASTNMYGWIRLPFAMTVAGALLGAVLLYSRANPVLTVGLMCLAGVFIATLTARPIFKTWQNVIRYLLGIVGFFSAAFGIIETDLVTSNKYGERFGQLAGIGLLAFLAGLFWFSKGWILIERGISSQSIPDDNDIQPRKRVWTQYLSLTVGLMFCLFILGVLSWTATSDWEYSPSKYLVPGKNDSNVLMQIGFIFLLTSWPYFTWKRILDSEPNSRPKLLKRHKRFSTLVGMGFVLAFGFVITLGIQNGNDRIVTDELTAGTKGLTAVASNIRALKEKDLKTVEDYLQSYGQIESLLPEYDRGVHNLATAIDSMDKSDQSRGVINIQHFYKSDAKDYRKNLKDMVVALRQDVELT